MFNNLDKNMKIIVKFIPENFINLTSKSAIYFGLAVYWCVILAGTVLNII